MGSKSLKVNLINKEFFQRNIRRCIISPVKAIIYNYRFRNDSRIIPFVYHIWLICRICVIWEKEVINVFCLPGQSLCIGIYNEFMFIKIPSICRIVITAYLITIELSCDYPVDKDMPYIFCAVLKPYYICWILTRLIKERSEEHTSELQSQSNLVCRLLLEKK